MKNTGRGGHLERLFEGIAGMKGQMEIEGEGSSVSRPVAAPLRILIVEDHRETRETLARLLAHFGHAIASADSKQSALQIVAAGEFDIVLSDIGLPDGNGYEVMIEAKRKRPVEGVALTGFDSAEDMRQAREAGFDFHLTKPIDFHELRTVLAQLAG